ncbi:DnaT-like ssDNA-binding domain-containing protein [Parahaliea mediterranea]|uniref:DnaT-like ssDNA-binding domain-containing protein n=1 Tax=Parahaliea mediterranea TaxID=651086 RepID=UPI000E2EEFE4|nr:DnaT-like ssDNA-binding domain-containing protein [Parahaliea mediterranea]
MTDSSLVPEQQLVFSPGLAATIGLEEAILLQQLHNLLQHRSPTLRDGYAWLEVERHFLLRLLPFWEPAQLHRILRSLVDKGVLLVGSPPIHSAERLLFALNEPASTGHRQSAVHSRPGPAGADAGAPLPRRSAAPLPAHWAPSEDLLQLLALNHNIPRQFALDQLEDFIYYWRERGETHHAWENKFRQHVTGAWRRHQQQAGEAQRPAEPPALDRHWRPSEDAVEIMTRGGVDREFIEEAIPEFVLYWRERGEPPATLNSKFIQHIRLQWARYNNVARGGDPTPISSDWQPDRDVYDILRLSHIDEAFARNLIGEFIVYWRDSGQAHTSWNSKFLQHVKYHWARQHQVQQAGQHHDRQQPGSHSAGRTRDRSLADDLNDTSWAN